MLNACHDIADKTGQQKRIGIADGRLLDAAGDSFGKIPAQPGEVAVIINKQTSDHHHDQWIDHLIQGHVGQDVFGQGGTD